MKYLVTGGAGFIGSHVVDELIRKGHFVCVYDNFSTGRKEFIANHLKNPKFKLISDDILNAKKLIKALKDIDFVFHFAAHADVRSGYLDHKIDHEQNLESTQSVLEAMTKTSVKNIAFSSTSSVYGDARIHPTPESYPFEPTSLYGATKAACESYIQSYASYYDWHAYIFRFVSFIGPRYTHGIIVDLMRKLKKNPNKIKLLSDGTPKKSSLFVQDGVNAMFNIIEKSKEKISIYNLGHDDIMTVDEIVNQVLIEMSLSPRKEYVGGTQGWKGDNSFVHLNNKKLRSLGWTPTLSFKQGIAITVNYLKSNWKSLYPNE